MKKRQIKTVIAALLVLLAGQNPGLAYSRSENDQPALQTKKSFWQTALDYTEGRWSAAKKDLDRASGLLEQAAKSASSETHTEIENLNHDIHALLKKYA
jgi:hypothetical protein